MTLQATQGSLVILDPHKNASVFWAGALLPARRISVVEGRVFLHFQRGTVDEVVIQAMREAGINVQEVA